MRWFYTVSVLTNGITIQVKSQDQKKLDNRGKIVLIVREEELCEMNQRTRYQRENFSENVVTDNEYQKNQLRDIKNSGNL